MFVVYLLFILSFLLLFVFKRVIKRKLVSRSFPAVELGLKKSGNIRVLTYNIAGLPQTISSAVTPRRESIEIIGREVNDFDIVNVQEDFNYNPSLYRYNTHRYRTTPKGRVPLGDGLNTLSHFPILEYYRVPWRHCTGSDCWTPKGFSLTRLQLARDVVVDVYNVHANAGISARATRARRENLKQLALFINDHSKDRPLLVFGDFNAHYGWRLDNLPEFIRLTDLQDVWVELYKNKEYPAIDDSFKAGDMLSYHNEVESIDKVFYRNSDNLFFTPVTYEVELDRFADDSKRALSDHLAVSVLFQWVSV